MNGQAELYGDNYRRDVEFDSDGVTLRGWHFEAQGVDGPAPIIVMCHGFAAVKEMWLDRYADVFAREGFHVLCYDNRNLGASDGSPRGEVNPWTQVADFRNAITFAETLPGVDAERIGIWGSSYSGGHVIVVAATDRRVKAVSSQVPLIDGDANFRQLVRADYVDGFREQFNNDRRARAGGEEPVSVEVVNPDPSAPSALPTPDSWEWYNGTRELRAPAFGNSCTLRSVEYFSEYQPGAYLRLIAPTPLLMCVAENDVVTPTKPALEGYEQALQPKQLEILPGGHFDAYIDGFDESAGTQARFFTEHLAR